MSLAQMWWGSSDVPSGVPYNLSVGYTNTGRGLRISRGVTGPGCGCSCGQRWVNLTFFSRFHLGIPRMPSTGIVFQSVPWIYFEGQLHGFTVGGGVLDDSSAKCGIRLRQYVYSGGVYLGATEKRMPRQINISNENYETDWQPVVDWKTIPAFTWTLDRRYNLEIDIEVRFRMYVEGTGAIYYFSREPGKYPFMFNVSQWYIYSI